MDASTLMLPWIRRAYFKGIDGYTYLNIDVKIYVEGELDMTYQVPCRFLLLCPPCMFFCLRDCRFFFPDLRSPNKKQTSVPIPWSHDKEKMYFNLISDIADFNLEKRINDPRGKETWIYTASYGKYNLQYVQSPKGIRVENSI